jgi:hypothetical protein
MVVTRPWSDLMSSSKIAVALLLASSLCACHPRVVAADHAAPPTTASDPMIEPAPVAEPRTNTGSISGHIQYGSESIPAMHICAIATTAPGRVGCVRTPRDQADYRIDGLAPGDYAVYGWFNEGDMRVIRARQTIMCIRAPCPPGDPVVVTLAPGDHYGRAHLNDVASAFPGMPAEPTQD